MGPIDSLRKGCLGAGGFADEQQLESARAFVVKPVGALLATCDDLVVELNPIQKPETGTVEIEVQSEKLNVLLSRIDRAELLQFLPGSCPVILKMAAHCLLIGNLAIPSRIVDVRAQPFKHGGQLCLAIQLEIAAREVLDVGG